MSMKTLCYHNVVIFKVKILRAREIIKKVFIRIVLRKTKYRLNTDILRISLKQGTCDIVALINILRYNFKNR